MVTFVSHSLECAGQEHSADSLPLVRVADAKGAKV